MKRLGRLAHRPQHRAGSAGAMSARHSGSIRRVGTVLIAAAALACIHREISGASDGSLLSHFAIHIDNPLRYLVSNPPTQDRTQPTTFRRVGKAKKDEPKND
ncbi:hypothetical protein [Paraburkholderia sp. BCC1886]|uniref:hypothetical protein n=1 Tax=Paraburkholderia sp. BCC1886 TaxID=2562670 RepID=UPI001182FAF0|nr:hypothetical protein [Paraburkholderia sp. BCC1886]